MWHQKTVSSRSGEYRVPIIFLNIVPCLVVTSVVHAQEFPCTRESINMLIKQQRCIMSTQLTSCVEIQTLDAKGFVGSSSKSVTNAERMAMEQATTTMQKTKNQLDVAQQELNAAYDDYFDADLAEQQRQWRSNPAAYKPYSARGGATAELSIVAGKREIWLKANEKVRQLSEQLRQLADTTRVIKATRARMIDESNQEFYESLLEIQELQLRASVLGRIVQKLKGKEGGGSADQAMEIVRSRDEILKSVERSSQNFRSILSIARTGFPQSNSWKGLGSPVTVGFAAIGTGLASASKTDPVPTSCQFVEIWQKRIDEIRKYAVLSEYCEVIFPQSNLYELAALPDAELGKLCRDLPKLRDELGKVKSTYQRAIAEVGPSIESIQCDSVGPTVQFRIGDKSFRHKWYFAGSPPSITSSLLSPGPSNETQKRLTDFSMTLNPDHDLALVTTRNPNVTHLDISQMSMAGLTSLWREYGLKGPQIDAAKEDPSYVRTHMMRRVQNDLAVHAFAAKMYSPLVQSYCRRLSASGHSAPAGVARDVRR